MSSISNKTAKEYTLTKDYRGREKEITGTLEYLTDYFSYTLLIGKSHNAKINLKPKTIKSLVSNLQRSFEIKESSCYERTFISQKEN